MVCLALSVAIAKYARKHMPFLWSHIDDFAFCDTDSHRLSIVMPILSKRLAMAGVQINPKKSTLGPLPAIKALGAVWDSITIQPTQTPLPDIVVFISALQLPTRSKTNCSLISFVIFGPSCLELTSSIATTVWKKSNCCSSCSCSIGIPSVGCLNHLNTTKSTLQMPFKFGITAPGFSRI